MNRSVQQLLDEAAELSVNERAELAGRLLESIEESRPAANDQAWAREIEHRMAKYRAGRIKTLSWEEVRAHLHRSDR